MGRFFVVVTSVAAPLFSVTLFRPKQVQDHGKSRHLIWLLGLLWQQQQQQLRKVSLELEHHGHAEQVEQQQSRGFSPQHER